MVPLKPSQAQSILARVAFARVELTDLEAYQGMTYITYQTDRTTRRNVEHAIENTVNAVTDIAKIVLAGAELGIPDTHKGIVLKMVEVGLASPGEAEALAKAATLRNRLAHRYLDLKWPAIRAFFEEQAQVVVAFLDRVETVALGAEEAP